eukprot:915470-Ditylum_brightwellii.AAC.1
MGLMVDEADASELTLCKQKNLKYTAMFDGFLHKEWTKSQDIHLWEKSLWTPCSNGIQWTVQIIKFLWNRSFVLWQERNEFVHGSNATASQQMKAEKYKATIETMYHFKDRLMAADWQYMFQSLAEVEEFLHTKTVQYFKDWIAIWYPFFKKGIKDGQKQVIAG